MNPVTAEVNQWYESLREQRLSENNNSLAIWTKYKNDLETSKSLLALLPKKVSHDVMVPIGPKALMRGKMVHTNEFLVNLGDTWFASATASQTIDICNRRINTCNEMIKKIEKERDLIVSKSNLPAEQEAFGSVERPEIIEFVTEEENEEWKKQHRIKEKEYRQQLAELREKEKKPIQTEEDLWKHLDELELQEELEDELNRLNEDLGSEEEESEESLEGDIDVVCSNRSENSDYSGVTKPKRDTSLQADKPKRRVSFVCDLESLDEEPLRLEIKHSNIDPVQNNSISSLINSPSDIFNKYKEDLHKIQVSVLKSSKNPNKEKELKNIEQLQNFSSSENEGDSDSENVKPISTSFQFNDVIERRVFDELKIEKTEQKVTKISKFRASRTKKH